MKGPAPASRIWNAAWPLQRPAVSSWGHRSSYLVRNLQNDWPQVANAQGPQRGASRDHRLAAACHRERTVGVADDRHPHARRKEFDRLADMVKTVSGRILTGGEQKGTKEQKGGSKKGHLKESSMTKRARMLEPTGGAPRRSSQRPPRCGADDARQPYGRVGRRIPARGANRFDTIRFVFHPGGSSFQMSRCAHGAPGLRLAPSAK